METSRKFVNFVIIITVVIATQGTTYGQGTLPCCEQNGNNTECCLCNLPNSNCSALGLKTLYSDDIEICVSSTSSTEATSSVGTTSSESEASTTASPGDAERLALVTTCVFACPEGFYEDQNQTCIACDALCKNCTMDVCLECRYGKNSSDHCCPKGTQLKTSGNLTICEDVSNTEQSDDDDTKYIIIGCVVGGLVAVGVLIVVVCLCCRRKANGQQDQQRPISRLLQEKLGRKKNYDYPNFQPPSANEIKSVEESLVTSSSRRPGPYENTATLDHRDIARRAQHEQDRIGRYAKDPTGKKKKKNQSNDDEEPQETYENQQTIDLHSKQAEVHKKKKGPFNKLSQKFRSKKGHKQDAKTRRKTEPPALTGPQEEYEDVNPPPPQVDIPMETYEDVGSGQQDFPQENYEGVDRSTILNDDIPTEEYTAMDPSTLQPQDVYQPKHKSKKPKKKGEIKIKGTENPTFSGENPYANYTPGSQQITECESDYQNYQNIAMAPEEEYVNY